MKLPAGRPLLYSAVSPKCILPACVTVQCTVFALFDPCLKKGSGSGGCNENRFYLDKSLHFWCVIGNVETTWICSSLNPAVCFPVISTRIWYSSHVGKECIWRDFTLKLEMMLTWPTDIHNTFPRFNLFVISLVFYFSKSVEH